MVVEPVIGSVAAAVGVAAGKEIVIKTFHSMVKQIGNLEKSMENGFKIDGCSMTVLCAENLQKYSLSLTPKKRLFGRNLIEFKGGTPVNISLVQFRGLDPMDRAIKRTPEGFSIDLNALTSDDLYTLDVDYRFEDNRLIDSLVERIIPKDAPSDPDDHAREYEMSAQLKHLDVLRERYYNVTLKDLEFSVDVSVYQDINTKVPSIFREQLEAIVNLSKKKGRADKYKQFQKLYQLQQKSYGGETMEILDHLHEIFTPKKFKKYVEISKDFKYKNCIRGSDYYDNLPFPTWPKSMKVTSKTQLNYNKPAAEGLLVYKQSDFISELDKIFPKKM